MRVKKIFLVVTGLILFNTSYCDVIPDSSHMVYNCIRITNIDAYSEIVFIADVENLLGTDFSYLVNDSDCIYKDYHLNLLTLYAINNDYIEGKNIDTLNLSNDYHAVPSTNSQINHDLDYAYYHDSIPVDSVWQFYKIMGFTDTSVVLFKWKKILKYSDETPDSIQTYTFEGDSSSLLQELNITGINTPRVKSEITLYPNPTKDFFNIKIDNNYIGTIKIDIYSIHGIIVKTFIYDKVSNTSIYKIPTHGLIKGAYLLEVQYGPMKQMRKILID